MVQEPHRETREIRSAVTVGDSVGGADNNPADATRARTTLGAEAFTRGGSDLSVAQVGDGRSVSQSVAAKSTGDIVPSDLASSVDKMITSGKFKDGRTQADVMQFSDSTNTSTAPKPIPEVQVQYSNTTNPDAPGAKPDFIVKANGDIVATRDFEKHGGNVVIQIERAEGQIDPAQNPLQRQSAEALVAYVNGRLRQDYPEAERNGVAIKDDQNLIDQGTENRLGMRNTSNLGNDYSNQTQEAVQNLRRFNGAGRGSMSREQSDNYFSNRDVPIQRNETNTSVAFKETVAALWNADKDKPYETVRQQKNEYRVGRYGFSGRQISNWLAGLDLGDPPDPAKIAELIKQGKLPKGFDAAQVSKLKALAQNMSNGQKPSEEDMKGFPKELQESMATDITKRMLAESQGDPSRAALAWMQDKEVGQVTAADMGSPEGKQIADAAQKAYSLATGRMMSEKGDRINFADGGEGSPLGTSIANAAQRVAENTGTVGWCYRGVKNALGKFGINLTGGYAKQAADQLASNDRVQEIRPDQVKPGDILVHQPAGSGRTKGQQYAGHIAVYLGNGKEASDHVQNVVTGRGYGGTRAFRVMSA